MAVSELHFPSPGLKVYIEGLAMSLIGIALIAVCVVILAFDPWKWESAIYIVSGIVTGAVGAVFTVLVWFIIGWGTIGAWREWRQLRPPAVLVDSIGVHYLARRAPVLVPWADIERVGLDRTIFRNRTVTEAFLRLTPTAPLLQDGPIKIPATRTLRIGLLSKLAIPETAAGKFFEEAAGTPLEIIEKDRRATAAGNGSY